jgi:hypothetical protein
MKFSELSTNYQGAICYAIYGKDMWLISKAEEDNLDYLTPEEMFDAWLKYEGIIGFTDQILNLHKLLFEEEK